MTEIKYVGISASLTSDAVVFANGIVTAVEDSVADGLMEAFKGEFELVSKPTPIKITEELKSKPIVESTKKIIK